MAAQPLLDDRFLLLEEVGRGGTATVYRAFDRSERKLVAVKVPVHQPGDEARVDPEPAWTEEFAAWRRLRHPNIIRALELRRSRRGPLPEGLPYLVLENFAGAPAHRAMVPGRIDPSTLRPSPPACCPPSITSTKPAWSTAISNPAISSSMELRAASSE